MSAPAALSGSYVPLITPLRDGQVDHAAYERLTQAQIDGGSDGIVVTGTSGEPSTLTTRERIDLVRTAVSAAAGRIGVVAATGSQSLAETLEITAGADAAGADAVLVVTPYYIRPPQRGLIAYFEQVAASTTRPVLIYHIPGRAAVSLTVDTVLAIRAAAPNVVGIKHAVDDLTFASELLVRAGEGFSLFCGLEQLSFPILAIGGSGLMNALGNLAPRPLADMCAAVREDRLGDARALHERLLELNQAVFWDTNPIPVKYLMMRCGLLESNEHRLPMTGPTPELAARLDDLAARAQQAGLLPALAPAGQGAE